jgi:hypothetical protein
MTSRYLICPSSFIHNNYNVLQNHVAGVLHSRADEGEPVASRKLPMSRRKPADNEPGKNGALAGRRTGGRWTCTFAISLVTSMRNAAEFRFREKSAVSLITLDIDG